MYLPTLSNKELLVYAEQTQDDLTTSDLERELIKRLRARVDEETDEKPLIDALDAAGIEDEDLPEIVKVLDEFCVTNAAALHEKLERADKFYDIAQDAGDVVDRLAGLVRAVA